MSRGVITIMIAAAALATMGALPMLGAHAAPPFPTPADRAGALPGARRVAAGPFLFYATLYADPRLRPRATAIAAWLTSDLPGTGARLVWLYRGRMPLGPVVERYAPLGARGCVGATYPRLHPGDRGGRDGGGVVLPAGIRPGQRDGFALDLTTPRGTYGVVIRYTVRSGPHGLAARNVTVTPAYGPALPAAC